MALEKPVIQIDMGLREHFTDKTTYSPSECYSCGTCTAVCPHNELKPEGEKLTVRKILHQAQIGVEPDDLVWQCSSCLLCELRCPRQVDIVDNFRSIRNYMIENRRIPAEFEQLLWNILEEGNPMGEPKAVRGEWAKGLDLVDANENEVDVLFYVGGPASYDPRLQLVAKDLAAIFTKLGIKFGVLGTKEPTSGEAIKETGEHPYLDMLVKQNVEQFNNTKAKKVIPISPHAYDIFKRLYPEYGLDMEVYHYTEYLAELVKEGKLKFTNKVDLKVTYHDPCYLGRYNEIYDAPRDLLMAIDGVELIEMENNRENAICCGGGGNKIYTDIKSEERLSNVRVEEAGRTEAQSIVTSCGYCIQNFEDSVKTTGTEMDVLDIAEVVAAALGVKA